LVLMQADASSRQAWTGLGVIALAGTAVIWRTFGADDDVREDEGMHSTGRQRRWDADSVRLVLCYGAFGLGYIIPATFLPLMARMTSAFANGQIIGPVLVSSVAGADADFSKPLLVACLLLVASAYILSRGH